MVGAWAFLRNHYLYILKKKKKKSNTSQERLHSRRNEELSQVKMQTQIYFKNYPVNLKLVEDGPYPRALNATVSGPEVASSMGFGTVRWGPLLLLYLPFVFKLFF